MKFKLVYENHGNYGIHVGDYFLTLKYGLESLGHTADIEYGFSPGYTNIVLECFSDSFAEKVEQAWRPGTKLIVVATEFLTGQTFNDIYQESDDISSKTDQNQRRDFWKMRYDNFIRLLPRMTAVWHVADQQVPVYKAAFTDTHVDYLPHGYTEKFATVHHRADDEKDIDVLFTGTITRYRQDILNELKHAGLNVASSILFTAPFHRDDLISRSKLVLNIKQHPSWQHESVTRLYYHITNDSLLVTDECQYPTDLHDYVIQREASWLQSIKKQIALGNFSARAKAIRLQFANERPIDQLFSKLLNQSGVT